MKEDAVLNSLITEIFLIQSSQREFVGIFTIS